MYDLSAEGQKLALSSDSKDEMEPAISGSRVVISDNRRGNSDIYMYDLSSKTEDSD